MNRKAACFFICLLLSLLITSSVGAQPDTTDPSLILYLSFDELQNGQVPDMSLHGNHGTLVGTPTLVPGRYGKAIELNGETDWVEIPHHESLTVETAVTVMAWIQTSVLRGADVFASPWQNILAKGNWVRSYSFYTVYTGSIHFSVNDWNGSDSTMSFQQNEWQHVAAQVENGEFRFWINGIPSAPSKFTHPPEERHPMLPGACDWKPVRVGNSHREPGRQFRGKIDEVRIWNRALTDAEIKAEMNQGLSAAAAADLKFDLNGDGVVDIEDVNILVEMLGQQPAPNKADFNNDAVINILDLMHIISFIHKRDEEPPNERSIRGSR